MSESRDHQNRSVRPWMIATVLAVCALAFLVVLSVYRSQFGGGFSSSHEAWGQFGDYVGGLLNPVFGFLSLLALLVALLLQSQELHMSTKELAKSASALSEQNESLQKQNFESTFFQLLQIYEELERFYVRTDIGDGEPNSRAPRAYESFYDVWRSELGHYFRTLYHIFKFIHLSDLSTDQKIEYANVARAQLSTYELCLLFYNGTWGEGKEGFKPLIEQYGLLKHVNRDDLLDPANMDLYYPTAFYPAKERLGYLLATV